MKTAVIYARYSSDSQTEQSIEGQLRVCGEYAERNDLLILDTYIDRAMTGTNTNRPDFKRMIKDSSKKEWDYVLVYKFDRFSRNQYESVINQKILEDNGAKLISAMENIPDAPEGIILKSVIESFNQYYSAELSQKVRRGMKETRIKGNFTGGTIIYGYKVENHKVIIDEEKAEVVKFIYKEYALGTYVKDIIAQLNEKHIYNKNKPFARNTIYNILKNEKYAGIYRFNDEVFDNMYPQIVPQDIYDIVRNKIDLNKYGKRSTEVSYLLKNKVKCGYCGSSITAECGTAKNGSKKRYYKCIGRKHHNGCNKLMIRKDFLENFILECVIEAMQKHIETIIETLYKKQNEMSNNNLILSALIKEKKQAETSLNNILVAVEQGLMNNTTNKRMKELEVLIEDIEKRTIIEKSKSQVKVSKEQIKQFYLEALKLEPQKLINYAIKEIRLFDDKVYITFNTPIKNGSDTSQSLFCITTKLMPYIIQNKPIQYTKFGVELYV